MLRATLDRVPEVHAAGTIIDTEVRMEQSMLSLETTVLTLIRDLQYFQHTPDHDDYGITVNKIRNIEEHVRSATVDEEHKIDTFIRTSSIIADLATLATADKSELTIISREAKQNLHNLLQQQELIERIEAELRREGTNPKLLQQQVTTLSAKMQEVRTIFEDMLRRLR